MCLLSQRCEKENAGLGFQSMGDCGNREGMWIITCFVILRFGVFYFLLVHFCRWKWNGWIGGLSVVIITPFPRGVRFPAVC